MLNIINDTRAKYGLAPYTLNATQSAGTASCIGSYGHSVHMAQVGYISHDQFPADICVSVSAAAENVGMMGSGNELQDLQGIHSEMMSEPYTPGCTGSHVCNLLSSQYRHVGIGIYYVNNATWLTENFLNP